MKFRFIVISFLAVCLAACSDGKLGEVTPPSDGYSLPQGGNAEADAVIQRLYDDYNSYFLYEFTERDFQWSMVSASTGSDVYTYTPIKADSVTSLLTVLEKSWLSFYPKEFLQKAVPKRVFLCQQVLGRGVFSSEYSEYPCRYLTYQLAVANPGVWDDLDELEKKAYLSYLNSAFLLGCYNSGVLQIPDEFFSVSDYSDTDMGSRKKARNAGFVKNERTGIEWATQGNSLNKTDDVDAYLSCLVKRTTDEWESDLSYDKIQRKYSILVAALKAMGLDLEAIGNCEEL